MVTTRALHILCILAAVSSCCLGLRSSTVEKMSILEAKGDGCLDTSGHVCACDGGPAKNINVSWEPVEVSPSKSETVKIDFTLEDDLGDGYLNASVFFHGEKEPFIGYGTYFTCKDFIKYLPFGSCPLKKGFHVRFQKIFEDLHALTSYPGDYDIEVQVYSQGADKKLKQIICLKFHVRVKEM